MTRSDTEAHDSYVENCKARVEAKNAMERQRLDTDAAVTPGDIARAFHEAYESLAGAFGYKTREESAVPWNEVPEPNKALMIATVRNIMCERRLAIFPDELAAVASERDRFREALELIARTNGAQGVLAVNVATRALNGTTLASTATPGGDDSIAGAPGGPAPESSHGEEA